MKCQLCGYENPDENDICRFCGSILSQNHNKTSKSMKLAMILSLIFPGFSYFYLKQWHKGILFFLLIPIFFILYALISLCYNMICYIDASFVALLLLITYFLLYVLQVYDIYIYIQTNLFTDN